MLGIVYHTGYLTDDIEAAIAFYEKTFGGQVLGRSTASGGGQIAYVKAGDSEVELIAPADKARLGGRQGLILDHIGYFVANLDQALAALKAKGVKYAEPYTSAMGYRIAYLDSGSTLGTRIHLTEKTN